VHACEIVHTWDAPRKKIDRLNESDWVFGPELNDSNFLPMGSTRAKTRRDVRTPRGERLPQQSDGLGDLKGSAYAQSGVVQSWVTRTAGLALPGLTMAS